jgi:hypothetical protein
MNIELDEVVQDVSDDALELAAGGAQGGRSHVLGSSAFCTSVYQCAQKVLAPASC